MTDEEFARQLLRRLVGPSQEKQEKFETISKEIRDIVRRHGDLGRLALARVGVELPLTPP